jgi:hypothetical protein
MTTYQQAVNLARDGDVRNRLHAGLMQVAHDVRGEAVAGKTAVWFAKRQALVDEVLQIGDNLAAPIILQWAWFAAVNMSNLDGSTDADIFSYVTANWDVLAGVTATDKV